MTNQLESVVEYIDHARNTRIALGNDAYFRNRIHDVLQFISITKVVTDDGYYEKLQSMTADEIVGELYSLVNDKGILTSYLN